MTRCLSSVRMVFTSTMLLSLLVVFEGTSAFPRLWNRGLIINGRPEIYFAADVVDQAYQMCWSEIQKDALVSRKRPQIFLKWIPIAGGRMYYLPYSEQRKLTLGQNCVLLKGIEIARRQEEEMLELQSTIESGGVKGKGPSSLPPTPGVGFEEEGSCCQ